jgi:hypothetical protein
MYDRTVQELPRTNNNIEGWHHGFQSAIGGCHPNIWKFLDALKKHQALQQVAMAQIMAGDEIVERVNIETVPDVFYTLWKTTTTVML